MRKSATVLAVMTLIGFILAPTTYAIDADEVIAKHLEAKGGVEKLKALKTIHKNGSMSMESMTGTVEEYRRAPHSMYLKFDTPRGVLSQGCNGKEMWSTNPMTGLRKFEGEEMQKRLDQTLIEPLIGYQERGGKVEYMGIHDVNGDSCHKLLFIQSTGDSTYSYFGVDNYHQIMTEVITPQGAAHQYFDDYRMIDGYLFNFIIRIETPMGKRKITYDLIAVNKPVPDSVFVMPEATSVESAAQPLPDSVRNKPPQRKKP